MCLNPPTINNALGCDGFPEQTITCYVRCHNKKVHHDNNKLLLNNKLSPALDLHEEKKLDADLMAEENSIDADIGTDKWNDWSSWSMICDADCKRSRRRECRSDKRTCEGPSMELDKCTYYCEPGKLPSHLKFIPVKLGK